MARNIDEDVVVVGNATVQGNAAVAGQSTQSGNVIIGGDQSVGGNVNIGGKTTIQHGNMVVNGNMKVTGWLDVTNLNFPAEGVFESEAKLLAAIPEPVAGHIAGVIEREQGSSDFQVQLYIVDSDSEQWVASGHYLPIKILLQLSGSTTVEGIEEWQRQIEADLEAKANVAELEILNVSGYQDRKVVKLTSNTYAAFLTEHQNISGKADKADVAPLHFNGMVNLEDVPSQDKHVGDETIEATYIVCADSLHRVFYGVVDDVQYQRPQYYSKWKGCRDYNIYSELEAAVGVSNRLFVDDATHKIYYSKSNVLTEAFTTKADKLPMSGAGAATENDFMAIDANGNIKDSGHKHSDYAAANHTHSGYEATANKVTVLSGSSTHTQYPSAKVVFDNLRTKANIEDLGRAVGEAVRCKFQFSEAGEFVVCDSEDLLLAVVDGMALLPDSGKISLTIDEVGEKTVAFVFKDPAIIPARAFADTPVKAVHIPSFVHSIGYYSFASTLDPKNYLLAQGHIDCEAMTPPTLDDAFGGADMSQATLTVHKIAEDAYTNGGNWGGVGTVNNY